MLVHKLKDGLVIREVLMVILGMGGLLFVACATTGQYITAIASPKNIINLKGRSVIQAILRLLV